MKWSLIHKNGASDKELLFESLLKDNGYFIEGIREYPVRTEYRVSKDGETVECAIPRVADANVVAMFESFDSMFDITHQLKTMMA